LESGRTIGSARRRGGETVIVRHSVRSAIEEQRRVSDYIVKAGPLGLMVVMQCYGKHGAKKRIANIFAVPVLPFSSLQMGGGVRHLSAAKLFNNRPSTLVIIGTAGQTVTVAE
jgi:hypothetical protein